MKRLIFLALLLFTVFSSYAQNPIKFRLSAEVFEAAKDTVKVNTQGTALRKGDQFTMYVSGAGNGNTTTRQLLFDLQYDNSALVLNSIVNTGTGGNGGILPQGSNAQESYYQYPGYAYAPNSNNTTSNGTNNYQYATYTYTANGPSTIVRYNLTWSGTAGMPYGGYWGFIKLTFTVKQDMVGFNMNPVKLNFVAGWTGTGALTPTLQESPLTTQIYLNPNWDSYVNAKIDVNSNLTTISPMKVMFVDTATNVAHLFDVTSNGSVNVDNTKLAPNKVYRVQAMVNMDKLYNIYNAAVTVSDFTGPQNEFVKTGLDGTPALVNMTTGASFLAADMNNDKKFDGADLPKLLAAAVAQDTLIQLPQGYTPGSNGFMSVWTFPDTTFNNMTPESWKTVSVGPGVLFRTGTLGQHLPLNLKYLLWGDVNRSHSSQVVVNNTTIVTKAVPSLISSGAMTNSINSSVVKLSTSTTEVPTIEANLNNLVVTSNTVNIPVKIDTRGIQLSALQFEFQYDPSKIKFEELVLNLPNTWYAFVNNKTGKVKFGALDRSTTGAVTGELTPFTLKFSTLQPGVDLITNVKITPTMDASDVNGNQIKIDLNTTTIKLTGYNNF